MTDSVLKPAEFRPATNYDTNPYYDENFDHSVVDPLKQIDERLGELEEGAAEADQRITALEKTPTIEPLVITVTISEINNGTRASSNKTYGEIETAFLQGKNCIIKVDSDPDYSRALVVAVGYVSSDSKYHVITNSFDLLATSKSAYPQQDYLSNSEVNPQ